MTVADSSAGEDAFLPGGVVPRDTETAMLMHDIRTALNGVLGGIAVVDIDTLPPKAAAQFDQIGAASRVLMSLVEQVMGQDCGLEGADPLPSFVDLEEYRISLLRRWRAEADARGLGFEVDYGPRVPRALACANIDLSRMIGNLVSNAIRYTRSGEVRITFNRSVLGGLEIEVRDTGPGVSEEILRAVSLPHVGNVGMRDGKHGLGLQIVKSLVADIGGRFSIRNDAERGLAATIWLPERLCVYGEAQRGEEDGLCASFPALEGARVLLAEDNPTNQLVARQMLDALKARVTVCSDGVEALEAYDAERFDLVLIDIEMPRLSGLEVIRTIRRLRDDRARVPIVALTAYAMREHRERIAEAGANGLVSKPITGIEALGRSLSAHLLRRPNRPQAEGEPGGSQDDSPVDRDIYDPLVAAIGPENLGELLDKVLADLVGAERELRTARVPEELDVVQAASHILISVGGAVGASRLLALARSVNVAVHQYDTDTLPSLVLDCVREAGKAIEFVQNERSKEKV